MNKTLNKELDSRFKKYHIVNKSRCCVVFNWLKCLRITDCFDEL